METKYRGPGKLVEDFIGEVVVAVELVVAPDVGDAAEALAEQGLQGCVEEADPARLVGAEGLVVRCA
jgi:hypothetical protein